MVPRKTSQIVKLDPDTREFEQFMSRFNMNAIPVEARDLFRASVVKFVTQHPVETWMKAWQGNEGTFLDILCWGHDQNFGEGLEVKGAMGNRHLTNIARITNAGGIVPSRDITSRSACVVGCWSGTENLLLAALGAVLVDGIEEVHEYAELAQGQLRAFSVAGRVLSASLYELPVHEFWQRYDLTYVPGVLYHLTDPVTALVTLWSMTRPGGLLAFETMVMPSPSSSPVFSYLGPSKVGWNWWCPSTEALVQMMRDCGFVDPHEVERSQHRAWFVGRRGEKLPLLDTAAAGFSRPVLLRAIRELTTVR